MAQMITPAVEHYLNTVRIPVRLACVDEAGWPRVLSLWYLVEAGALYCATLETARVVTYLRAEPRCAFEVAADDPPYCGVRGRAVAEIDPSLGSEILSRLLVRYLGGTDSALAQWLLSRADQEVALVIRPASLHTWDFRSRMRDAVGGEVEKVCP